MLLPTKIAVGCWTWTIIASEFVSIRVYCSTKEHCTMYTIICMHTFHFFFQKNQLYNNWYITQFSLKKKNFFLGGGGQCITGPPILSWGGAWPPDPPVADTMVLFIMGPAGPTGPLALKFSIHFVLR